jgi:PAS domain S-box-containing protein
VSADRDECVDSYLESDLEVLNQPARLAAVSRARAVLAASDVPLERLTRIAAAAADAPIGAISLLDAEVEHFVATHGTDLTRAPRPSSLCQYVVSADRPVLIADTAASPVPADVRAAGLVAYVGVPIHLDGMPVGAVCLADQRPREWSVAVLDVVRDAADLITALLAGDAAAHDIAATAADSASALESLPEAFISVDADGVIQRWSNGATRMFGRSPAQALGRGLVDLVIVNREEYLAAVGRVAPGLSRRPLLWVRDRDGREFPADVSISPADISGRLHLFLHDARDRLAAERDAQRHRSFLEAVLESLDAAVAACDDTGRLILMNRTLRDLCGLPDDPAPAGFDLFHPDGRQMAVEEVPLYRALGGERVSEVTVAFSADTARAGQFQVKANPLRSADDEPLGAVMVIHEVSDLVRANRFKDCEIAVSRVLQRDATLADGTRDALEALVGALHWSYAELWLVDAEADVLTLAGSFRAPGHDIPAFGTNRLGRGQGLVGGAWDRGEPVWLSDLHSGQTMLSSASVVSTGLRTAVAVPVRSGEQILGVLALFANTVEDPHGVLEALLSGVAAHIGQFLERRHGADLAAELAKARHEYIGLVGHEMRTPLTSISAYTDLVLDDPDLDGDHRSMLVVVQRNAATLRSIIGALLDLAALDSGHADVRLQPANAANVVNDALDSLAGAAAGAGLKVVTEVDSPVVAAIDTARLRQVVDTLLDNAVKYTPVGGTVTVRLAREGPEAVLSVDDTGVGIPAAERGKLFRRFFRGTHAKAAGIPGSGLGLAIARAVMDKHNGTIAMSDRDGAGATFVVRLPLVH